MKLLFILVIGIGIANAGSTLGEVSLGGSSKPPATSDGVLYEQPYDFPNIANGVFIEAPQFAGADNFTFSSSAEIRSITFWSAFTGSGHPFDIAVDVYEYTPEAMGTHIWGETVAAAYQTETLTGDEMWGLDLYKSDLQLQTLPTIPAGDYWLVIRALDANAQVAWLVCNPIYPPNMMQFNNGTWVVKPWDCWFGLYDHDVSLARATWASIKTTF